MSQYQPPYYQPPYVPPNVVPYYGPPIDPLRPARRASVLMFIVGPLLLACGVIVSSMRWVIPNVPPDQFRQLFQQMQSMSHLSVEEFLSDIFREGVVITVIGLGYIVLAVLVRRGGRVPAILASMMTGLVLLSIAGGILFSITMLGSVQGVCQLVMQLAIAAVFGSLMYLLIQAARASSGIKSAQQRYQAQYWQYQQNMQAYQMQAQQMPPNQITGQPSTGYPTAPPALPSNSPPVVPPAESKAPPSEG